MIGTTNKVVLGAALLALGSMTAACGDDDGAGGGGTDAGRPDAGSDAGPSGDLDGGGDDDDAGDADGGLPAASIRLAHLISNAGSEENPLGLVHVCLEAPTGGAQSLLTQRVVSGTATPFPIPYRGVSDYISTGPLMLLDLEYTVHVYPLFEGATCPAPDTALFSIGVDAGDLLPGNHYTIAAIGLLGGTDAQAPQLVVIEDDLTEPADGEAHVRLVHAIVNLTVAVDVCWDPDFEPPATPGEEPAVSLFADERFIGRALDDPPTATTQAIEYVATEPVAMGLVSVYLRGDAPTDCATVSPATAAMRIPVPLPVPPSGTPNVPENISQGGTFDEGEIITLFAVGDLAFASTTTPCDADDDCTAAVPAGQTCNLLAGVCQHPRGPSVVPWVDNLTP